MMSFMKGTTNSGEAYEIRAENEHFVLYVSGLRWMSGTISEILEELDNM